MLEIRSIFLILENDFLKLENTDLCPQCLAVSFVSFRFDLFHSVSIYFVSFRFVSFRFDLFRFVPFRFCFVSHFTGTPYKIVLPRSQTHCRHPPPFLLLLSVHTTVKGGVWGKVFWSLSTLFSVVSPDSTRYFACDVQNLTLIVNDGFRYDSVSLKLPFTFFIENSYYYTASSRRSYRVCQAKHWQLYNEGKGGRTPIHRRI